MSSVQEMNQCKNCKFYRPWMLLVDDNFGNRFNLPLNAGLCINQFSNHYQEAIQENHDCISWKQNERFIPFT